MSPSHLTHTFAKNTPASDRTLGKTSKTQRQHLGRFSSRDETNETSRTLPNSSPPAPRLSFTATAGVEWGGQGSCVLYSCGPMAVVRGSQQIGFAFELALYLFLDLTVQVDRRRGRHGGGCLSCPSFSTLPSCCPSWYGFLCENYHPKYRTRPTPGTIDTRSSAAIYSSHSVILPPS